MMDRRSYITSIGAVTATAMSGCMGQASSGDGAGTDGSSAEPVSADEEPQAVTEAKPLMRDFGTTADKQYEEVRVFYNPEMERVVMAYTTAQESVEGLKKELYQIAELYANVVHDADHEAEHLSIVTGEVQAVVEPVPAEEYGAGELKKDAYHETISVTKVTRRDE